MHFRMCINYKIMNNYHYLEDALDDLKSRGYKVDFETNLFCLYCGELNLTLNPEQFIIDEVYPFIGDPCTDDNPTLYAITSIAGIRGTLIDRTEFTPEIGGLEWQIN